MVYNKHKGVLVFMILYTVLFVLTVYEYLMLPYLLL